jgi:hypothetical protein
MSAVDQVIAIGGALVPLILDFLRTRGADIPDGLTAEQIQTQVIEPHADKILADIDAWKAAHPPEPPEPNLL